MNQLKTEGIVLQRTDYGEADRILTVLSSDQGKLHLIAKGARRVKSKLAGGIELFSVSELLYVQGKGSLGTLVSTRLIKHFDNIVHNIDRTMLGYDLIKMLHKTTEDEVGKEFFDILHTGLALLDDASVSPAFVETWFSAQLLRQAGHMPNLTTDPEGTRLVAEKTYRFDLEAVCFREAIGGQEGASSASTIKYMRLLFSDVPPHQFVSVENSAEHITLLAPLVRLLRQNYLSV